MRPFRVLAVLGVVAGGLEPGELGAQDGALEPRDPVFLKHQAGVWSVALSPDGMRVVFGGSDRTVRLWDSATGKELATMRGHGDVVRSVALGERVASGSWDGSVRLWDAAAGKELFLLQGHESRVWMVAFAPGGKVLASGSEDKTVRLWDVRTGMGIAVLRGHEDAVRSLAFSTDGRRLASASLDGTVILRETRSWKEAGRILDRAGLSCAVLSPSGKILATGGFYDAEVRLWGVGTGVELLRLRGHEKSVTAVAFSRNGKVLASAGLDRTIRLWDVKSGRQLASASLLDAVLSIAWEGKILAAGCWDGTVVLMNSAPRGADDPGVGLRFRMQEDKLLTWENSRSPQGKESEPGTSASLSSLWADLAGDDAARAYSAMEGLARAEAVEFVTERLRPGPKKPERIARLIAQLDDDRLAVRDRSSAELEAMGEAVEPELRLALQTYDAPEVRQRVMILLDKPPLRTLRLRGIQTLEWIGTAKAAEALRELAREAAGTWAGKTAQQAAERLQE